MIRGKKRLSWSQMITRNPLDSDAAQHLKAGISFALKEQLIMNLESHRMGYQMVAQPGRFHLERSLAFKI
jgi:hypothetical protein